MNRISYGLIFEALEHYSRLGFTYVEVPWLVSRAAVDVTLPADRTPFMCGNDALVGIRRAVLHPVDPRREAPPRALRGRESLLSR